MLVVNNVADERGVPTSAAPAGVSGKTRGGGLLWAFVFMGDQPKLPGLPLALFLRLDRRLSSAHLAVLGAGALIDSLQHHALC